MGGVVTGAEAGRVWVLSDVDIEPADARKAYDVRVHTFPEGRHRHVRTTEHGAVPARQLGTLVE